jgi:hypothetical protein
MAQNLNASIITRASILMFRLFYCSVLHLCKGYSSSISHVALEESGWVILAAFIVVFGLILPPYGGIICFIAATLPWCFVMIVSQLMLSFVHNDGA